MDEKRVPSLRVEIASREPDDDFVARLASIARESAAVAPPVPRRSRHALRVGAALAGLGLTVGGAGIVAAQTGHLDWPLSPGDPAPQTPTRAPSPTEGPGVSEPSGPGPRGEQDRSEPRDDLRPGRSSSGPGRPGTTGPKDPRERASERGQQRGGVHGPGKGQVDNQGQGNGHQGRTRPQVPQQRQGPTPQDRVRPQHSQRNERPEPGRLGNGARTGKTQQREGTGPNARRGDSDSG